MQTRIKEDYLDTTIGQEAERILRSCVHCGFCTATCPTYQILGDERDGPRGRIYLIKQVLEGKNTTRLTQQHLDRCLTCRSCETTCPSGVEYGHLLDIGRAIVEKKVSRPLKQKILRKSLGRILPYSRRLLPWVKLAQRFSFFLPPRLKRQLPDQAANTQWPTTSHTRKMILPGGCAQAALAPHIDACTARVLDKLGIELIRRGGCCGAVNHHLNQETKALQLIKQNIDAWWPQVENGAEAILSTASGCGVMLKDYGHLLKDDPDYADKAQRIAALSRDLVEVLENENLDNFKLSSRDRNISFHSPCTLQHGQGLTGRVETLLSKTGLTLNPVRDSHLCCGSAGTYSITQPGLSKQLRQNKLAALTENQPHCIATANIGCLLHLQSESPVPVIHWIQLLD